MDIKTTNAKRDASRHSAGMSTNKSSVISLFNSCGYRISAATTRAQTDNIFRMNFSLRNTMNMYPLSTSLVRGTVAGLCGIFQRNSRHGYCFWGAYSLFVIMNCRIHETIWRAIKWLCDQSKPKWYGIGKKWPDRADREGFRWKVWFEICLKRCRT